MAKGSYIEFHYNYDGHERAIRSSLLLFYLLKEKVNFTSVHMESELQLSIPEILIKTSEDETLSRYHLFDLQDSKGIENFKRDCGIVRESSLEKEIKGVGGMGCSVGLG